MEKRLRKRYNSFFMGGFECADHINRSGFRVNLLRENQHDLRVEQDYRLLIELDIKVVREGICWSSVEKSPGVFDFSEVRNRLRIAENMGIEVVWDLCHFGYPDAIFPTHPLFLERFKSLCTAFAQFHKKYAKDRLHVVPVNEISFLSWHSGDVRGTVPFAVNSGFDIKYHLCKAAIEGMKILRNLVPHAVIYVVEPLIWIHKGSSEITETALAELNSHQFQAVDMIAGNMCEELGGNGELFDVVGFNYYHSNQWDHEGRTLSWPLEKEKLLPLNQLLHTAYSRLEKPVILSETGHFGSGRAQWIQEITQECLAAIDAGVDLQGICIYPVIDRPDWDNLNYYHNSGIFDLDEHKNRIPDLAYIQTLKDCIKATEDRLAGNVMLYNSSSNMILKD
ncbi:hypothetical protein [Salinimicrobium oceani]|uniref:Beta-glucosidase/6-phospho-beta-glucosidase/beta-galactosidase n=1 Tax=Salinimicrobium oceani TaxID=2722702 RepID=A0ABX1CWL3_9FLAO|nr:hypothetical protein [Salinimicrobium oceani]NJW51542.1 hypothetical protein [Salinimicrobium oceani]